MSKSKRFHPRSRHNQSYDFEALVKKVPDLDEHLILSPKGKTTIDFSQADSVRLLNTALLKYHYGIKYWEFPEENLCPPIPGRAEYIHHIADVLYSTNPRLKKRPVKCLDIGTGSTLIYPIIGIMDYDWDFIVSDIDEKALESAWKISTNNPQLKKKVSFRLQNNAKKVLNGIITKSDKIDITICNPPFYSSIEEASSANLRKIKNLSKGSKNAIQRNFAGNANELIYRGGEFAFISTMISESKNYALNCRWFSSLVSKGANLKGLVKQLDKAKASRKEIVEFRTKNKSSRIIAWSYTAKNK